MKKIINIIAIVASIFFAGCTGKSTICPKYPNPNIETVQWLLENNIEWLEKQQKLKLKLEVCNK